MLRYLVCFFWLISFSLVFSSTKEYFVVLSTSLEQARHTSIQALSSGASLQSVPGSLSGASSIKLIKHNVESGFKKPGVSGPSKIRSAVQLSSLSHSLKNEHFVYLMDVDEVKVNEFKHDVQSLDSYLYHQPNYTYTISTISSIPSLDTGKYPANPTQVRALEMMKFPDVWQYASGNGVIVAVLDSGINASHIEFCGPGLTTCEKIVAPINVVQGIDISKESYFDSANNRNYSLSSIPGETCNSLSPTNYKDFYGHGTHVAGIIVANDNDTGIVGAAYGARVMPIKAGCTVIINGTVDKYVILKTRALIDGITHAIVNNADILNLSLGGSENTFDDDSVEGEGDLLFYNAILDAYNNGILVVAAAGNNDDEFDPENSFRIVPAAYPEVMAVSSVSSSGQKSGFSNFGDSVDVGAFGGDGTTRILTEPVISAGINSNYGFSAHAGTSQATPFVAALAALIKSRNPTLTVSQIRQIIRVSANRNGLDQKYVGYGIINAANAFTMFGDIDSSSTVVLEGTNLSDFFSDKSIVCYPNPLILSSNVETECEYRLNKPATMRYWIISRRGQIMRQDTFNESRTNQRLSIKWNGKVGGTGSEVSNGVYQLIVEAVAEGESKMTKKHMITVYR